MSKNISELPFTEIVERAAKIARIENDPARVRGALHTEISELNRKEDFIFFFATTAIACTPQFTTGTVSVNTQDTTATFSSDVVLTADFTGRQLKMTDNDNIYTITFSNTTAATISPPLSGDLNVTNGAYTIFQPIYAMPRDFARFPKNGGVLKVQGGRYTPLEESAPQEYYRDYTPSPGTPSKVRLVQSGTDGLKRIELMVPPSKAFVFPVEYIRTLEPLRQSTGGFVDISAGGTTVTGSAGTTLFTEARTGWYVRIDAFGTGDDSEWYRVAAIANNSSLTIGQAFGLSGATTARYTLSAAPDMPELMHPGILYGTVCQLMADQSDPLYAFMSSQKTAVLLDARRIYKTRVYSQFMDTIMEDYQFRR